MSHPHDGFDYESGVDYGPGDEYYYAWLGDESNSMMSYIDLNWDFSQFDRDNMHRYLVATYLNTANTILKDIAASPKVNRVGALLSSADTSATEALSLYDAMSYTDAALAAKAAYDSVLEAAAAINIKVESQAWQADYKAKGTSSKFSDSYIDRIGPDHKRFRD